MARGQLYQQDYKPQFSGHETFPLRYGWLKKCFDRVAETEQVIENKSLCWGEDSIARYGVGKNMVSSMRHWSTVCGIIEETPGTNKVNTTSLGKFLFGEPYKNWDLPKEHRQSAPAPTQRERHRQAYEATIKERESKLARVETGFLQEEIQTQECEKCRQTNPSPTPSGASATCPKCGDTSPDEATHCISCGNQLPELI